MKETSNGEYRLKDLDTKNPSIAKAEDSFELRNGVARINLTNKGVTNASDAKQGTDYIYACLLYTSCPSCCTCKEAPQCHIPTRRPWS